MITCTSSLWVTMTFTQLLASPTCCVTLASMASLPVRYQLLPELTVSQQHWQIPPKYLENKLLNPEGRGWGKKKGSFARSGKLQEVGFKEMCRKEKLKLSIPHLFKLCQIFPYMHFSAVSNCIFDINFSQQLKVCVHIWHTYWEIKQPPTNLQNTSNNYKLKKYLSLHSYIHTAHFINAS